MEKATKQTIIGIEGQKQIGVLATAEDDGLVLKFDACGKFTPSTYVEASQVNEFSEVKFKRLATENKQYRLADSGYFSPETDSDVVITIHVNEVKRAVYNITFNAYRRRDMHSSMLNPQYLGSKSLQVGLKS